MAAQFYVLDPNTNEWIFVGSSTTPTVADNAGQTLRSNVWTLDHDPPSPFGAGTTLEVVAVG